MSFTKSMIFLCLLFPYCLFLYGNGNTTLVKKLTVKEKAQKRMQKDLEYFSREDIVEINALYDDIMKNYQGGGGRKSLKDILKKYPQSNRTGCVMLFIAELSSGKKREEALFRVIKEFSDCWYSDGVQTGVYARYLLGLYYLDKKQNQKADILFNQIRIAFPDAVDHSGDLLIYRIGNRDTQPAEK